LGIVLQLAQRVRQREFRECQFVEDLLPQNRIGACADFAQPRQCRFGRVVNHLRIIGQGLNANQPIVIRRTLRVDNGKPLGVWVEA